MAFDHSHGLARQFGVSAKKLWATALFATLSATTTFHAQKSPDYKSVEWQDDHAKHNAALLDQARMRFPVIAGLTATHYARELDSLSTAINKKDNPRIFVMDAYMLDVGLALGIDIPNSVEGMLVAGKIPHTPEIIDDLSDILYRPSVTMEGRAIYAQYACVYSEVEDYYKAPRLFLIPTSDNTPRVTVDGMSVAQSIRLVNAHEAGHACERFYPLDGINLDNARNFNYFDIDQIRTNADGLKWMTQLHKREVIADVIAVCRLINAGEDPSVIDALAADRRTNMDLLHFSSPVLDGLKIALSEIGIPALKKYSEEDLFAFCHAVTEKYGVDHKGMALALAYFVSSDDEKAEIEKAAMENPDDMKALLLGKALKPQESPGRDTTPAPLPDSAMLLKLRDWNPMPLLIASAQEKNTAVTPETMIIAYGDMMDALAAERRRNPADEKFITQKMMKLKNNFITKLADVNFTGINQANGISPRTAVKIKPSQLKP